MAQQTGARLEQRRAGEAAGLAAGRAAERCGSGSRGVADDEADDPGRATSLDDPLQGAGGLIGSDLHHQRRVPRAGVRDGG